MQSFVTLFFAGRRAPGSRETAEECYKQVRGLLIRYGGFPKIGDPNIVNSRMLIIRIPNKVALIIGNSHIRVAQKK